ncbi:hypothetical protein [Aurantimicrobium minutum]|uniref:hypothetical protein n=1 Tax=Aurantimicrobium minutum TaxID=708131 RepID=UPI002472ED65|nr:hypothetical protein [Aurantimicrobium minutum]
MLLALVLVQLVLRQRRVVQTGEESAELVQAVLVLRIQLMLELRGAHMLQAQALALALAQLEA